MKVKRQSPFHPWPPATHFPPVRPSLSPFAFQKYFGHVYGDTMYTVLYLVFPLKMSQRSFVQTLSDLISAQLTKVLFSDFLVLHIGVHSTAILA